MIRSGKQIVASLLAAALLIGQLGATAYAEGPPSAGGLCEHHMAHDAACGYEEAVQGHPCEHEHTLECYTDELICGDTDGDVQTASGNDAGHQHGQECYKLDCPHERGEHDGACGYIKGVKGTPCGNVCTECGGEPDKDSGTISGNNPPAPVETAPGTVEPEDAGKIRVTAFDELGDGVKVQTVPKGTELENLNLPVTLGASGYTVSADTEPVPEPITITDVMWELTGENNSPITYEDGREKPCNYYFQPVLPKGYTLDGGVELPKIVVRYGWGTRAKTNDHDTGDVTAFKAILTAHPALKNITGVDENDPASWATAGLVTWDGSSPNRLIGLTLIDKGLSGTLDVSGLSTLESLNCYQNQLKKLDVSGTAMTYLICYDNELTELTGVSGLSTLELLNCSQNQLDKLDVSGTALTDLACRENELTALTGLAGLSTLESLSCSQNQLDKLNVSGTALTGLACYANPLTEFTAKNGKILTITAGTGGKAVMIAYTPSNNEVQVLATPDSGYIFKEWTGLPVGASITEFPNFSLSDNISVSAVFARATTPVTGVTLDKPALTLTTGQTATLTAAVEPANASNKTVKWESSSHSVATVSNGTVTAAAPGTATITVTTTDGGKKDTCTVTVKEATIPVTGVTLDKPALTLTTGQTATLNRHGGTG